MRRKAREDLSRAIAAHPILKSLSISFLPED